MRILHVIHSLNPAHGGTTSGLFGLVQCMVEQKHDVTVLSSDDPASPWLKNWPCDVHAAGAGVGKYAYSRTLKTLLRELVGGHDWVIVHGLWQYHGRAAREVCLSASVPYAVFPHGMLDGWFARAYPWKHLQKQLYWWWAEYRVLRDAEVVFFTTPGELEAGRRTFWPFQVRPAIAPFGISPPVDPASTHREAFREKHPNLCGRRTLLFMGRLHHKKGCDLLIEGFGQWLASVSPHLRGDWQLRIVGPREDEQFARTLEALAARYGLFESGLVVFVDTVEGNRKWQELAHAEALILPSHQENFGVVIAEALACGTPVLISRNVNGWDSIEKAGAGLAESDTSEGVVLLLKRWTGLSEQQRLVMRKSAVQYFDRSMSSTVGTRAVIETLRGSRG